MRQPLSRRTVLGGAAALAACGPSFELHGLFPLGVASGEATATGALLWTLYRGEGPLRVKVWTDDGATVFEAAAPVEEGEVVHVEASGLVPFTWHRFQFTDGAGVRSVPGRFRTALAPGAVRPLTFGAVSCTKEGYELSPLAQAGARLDLDAFLLLGDTIYADGADDLAGFRAKWRSGLADPSQQALRASTSVICTWDDHELFNNWDADAIPKGEFDAGLRAYFEHQPTRPGPGGRKIWRSFKWGDTAEVFVLDCRGERWQASGQYISPDQMTWLKEGLANSTAVFKLIMNSVPISRVPGAFFETGKTDRWEGYPKQREEILSFIDDAHLRGVLWISGDFHLAMIGRVALGGPGQHQIEALVGPGGQMANPSPSYPSPPQFDWASGTNNYAAFELDPTTVSVRMKYFDGQGTVIQDRTYVL